MKTIGLLGLVSLLSTVAYHEVAGTPPEAAQRPDRSVTLPVPAFMDGNGDLPTSLSDYVFLHQTRHESVPVHAMAGAKTCPE